MDLEEQVCWSEPMTDLSAVRARPGTDRRQGRMWRWDRYGPLVIPVAVAIVLALVFALIRVIQSSGPAQFTLRMQSSPPLTLAACGAEVATYGWNVQGGPPAICRLGEGKTWYHAMLVNHGGDAYPDCRATAFDARGKVLFSRDLYFNFAGYTGLEARGHRSTAFTWYIPNISAPVARYVTSCVVEQNPPI
jgi:hypothetical protein